MKTLKLKNQLNTGEICSLESMVEYCEKTVSKTPTGKSFAEFYQQKRTEEILEKEKLQITNFLGNRLLSVLQDYLLLKEHYDAENDCECLPCESFSHLSDCAIHNAPALPVGECDCVSGIGI